VNGAWVQRFLYRDQLEPVAEIDVNGCSFCGKGDEQVRTSPDWKETEPRVTLSVAPYRR